MSEYIVSSGEVSSGIILNNAESMTVLDGGTASVTTVNSGGKMYLSSGGVAEDTTLNSRGAMYVSSGGMATRTVVSARGSMYLSSGGQADSATLFSGGILNVSAGGTATNADILSGGRFTVNPDGIVNGTMVSGSGRITVSSGGTATGITLSDGALPDFTVAPDTLIAGISAGSAFEIRNGRVSGYTVNSGGTLNISSGGAADSLIVNGGIMYVETNGTLNNTTLNSGTVYVYEEGAANSITVSGGYLAVSDRGIAGGIAVSAGGSLCLYRKGVANNVAVFSGGRISVSSGGVLNNAFVSGGLFAVTAFGLANSATVNGGDLQISSGGTADDIIVASDGSLNVLSGGTGNRITVNSGGRMILESKGASDHVTVGAGGILKNESGGNLNSALVQSDGRLLGYFNCADVTFESGAALYFDVSSIAPENTAALVDLTGLADPETIPFRLLISDSQETGVYRLAAGAAGFDRTISVVNSVMELGSVSMDQPVWINGREYTLNLNDDELTLSVTAPTAQYVYLDFDGEDLVRYSNSDLALAFDLSVAAPGFSEEQRAAIVSELTKQYNRYNIAFTLERPEGVEYSTLYFGQSPAFAEYGDFFGVAETHDGNNQIKNDNAFVLVDGSYSDGQIISVASHMLDHLLGISYFVADGAPALREYAENRTLLSYSSDWIQSDPYNKYCPVDPEDGKRCVTGCTNNAASQIIYYWLEKGMLDLTLSLEKSDAYKCTTGIVIDSSDDPVSGHLSFAETNKLLADFKLENIDSIAALCFAAGVIQMAQYSSISTGASWDRDVFIRAGFDPASVVDKYMTYINWPKSSESYVDPDTRLADDDIMVNEMLQGRPVGISLRSIGHAVVVDGYDSSRNMFHLNYGWGEDKNRWCTLEDLIELQIDEAVIGIAPIVSPDLAVNHLSPKTGVVSPGEDVTLSFTVSNEGKEMSEETMAYVYFGDTLLGYCGLNYISPGYSRDFTCSVSTASLKEGKNVLTVKVGSQNAEGSISSASCEVTIDSTAPVITLSADTETVVLQTALTAAVDDGSQIYYRISEFGKWKKYTEPVIASLNETYYFMAMDEAGNIGTNQIAFGNIDTSGIMLSTLWAQSGICPMGGNTTICYNEYTPYDPTVSPDTHSLVGCTNTADGQLIYYFIEKEGLDLALTLDKTDEYTSSKKAESGERIVIEIKSDGSTPGTLSFAKLNELLSDFKLDSAEHAAALSYACGVVNHANYSADATGTGFIWNHSVFTRSGLKSAISDGPYLGSYYWGYWDDDMDWHISDAGYEVLIENLEAGRPVGTTYPGHAMVIDGYDRATDTFHINYGWGYNQATRWYTREEMFEAQLSEFLYDLRLDYIETFTVTDARVYGTGTMFRAFEQAAGMIDANTVAFDPSVAGETVELLDCIRIYDEVTVKDLNMNVLVTRALSDESPAYGVYTYGDSLPTFHISGGSLIVSTSNEYNHAFNLNKASSGTVNADHALVYAGRYSVGAAAVLEALQVARSEKTEVPEDLLDSNGWSFYGSAGNDVFSLSDLSIAVGNVSLGDGDDVLSLAGHSRLYGTIDAGDGDDSITVDSTSSISGDLSGKSKLNFVLTEREDHTLFTIKSSVSGLCADATVTVDMKDAKIGTYTLFSAASGATGITDLRDLAVTVTGSGEADFTLSVNGTASSDFADLICEGNSLKLQIKKEPEKPKWTYLVYMAADNNLSISALYDIISMQQAKLDSEIDIYVLADRTPAGTEGSGDYETINGTYKWDSDWDDTRVGKITYSPGLTVTVDWTSWGELDTGSSETLERFVNWVQEESPAENYGLILWDHGGENASLCWDYTTDPNKNAFITVSEVAGLLKEKGNIPIVIFNNCLLASEIAATQLSGSTDVVVLSEPTSFSRSTFNYNMFFHTITPDMTPREMAAIMVKNVESPGGPDSVTMLSSIDVTDSRLGDALEALAVAVSEAGNDADKDVLIHAMLQALQDGCDYAGTFVQQSDLGFLIRDVLADPDYGKTSEGFRQSLADVRTALESIVLEYRSVPAKRGSGIAVCNPVYTAKVFMINGSTLKEVGDFIQSYLISTYGSNPLWGGLLNDLCATYLAEIEAARIPTAVFSDSEVSGLVDGRTVTVSDLGGFSGRGESFDYIKLSDERFFGFAITEADKSTGSFTITSDVGAAITVSLLAADGTEVATGTGSVSFQDLAVGTYYLRLQSGTDCRVTITSDATWWTGVDRFEGNDSYETAVALDAGYYTGLITCEGDQDYYLIGNEDALFYTIEVYGEEGWTVGEYFPDDEFFYEADYADGKYTMMMSFMGCLLVEGTADLKDGVNAYSVNVIPYEDDFPEEVTLDDLVGTKDWVSWEPSVLMNKYTVEYSTDDFGHTMRFVTTGTAVDMLNLPAGTYQWRVTADSGKYPEWFDGEEIVSDDTTAAPNVFRSDSDANDDIFFATPVDTWSNIYYAKHVGSIGDWSGTNELVSAAGKSRIQDLFFGSADPGTLYLTDSENGDALFLDDVYTGLPEEIEENTARLFRLHEIIAGAGDDIVDMTSQQFGYLGSDLLISGGDGDDVIWASRGSRNTLFGDAGNDRLVGASGDDVIVGGIGDDRMHGGGGNDIFTFCDNWGHDTVEQRADGTVTLWFFYGSIENWDEETLTYSDGENSVKVVSDISADQVTLNFGPAGSKLFGNLFSMGAFTESLTKKVFDDTGKGLLASV